MNESRCHYVYGVSLEKRRASLGQAGFLSENSHLRKKPMKEKLIKL